MSVFREVKLYLLRDKSKIETLLGEIGCQYIKFEQKGELITCQLPDSSNKRSVQIRMNNSLSSTIRNRGDFKPSDIFDLISYIKFHKRREDDIKDNLSQSLRYICEVTGLTYLLDKKRIKRSDDSQLDWLLNLKKNRRRKEIEPNLILPEDTMSQFYYKGKPLPYQGWIDEGISHSTQMKYGIGFCLDSKRIVIPLQNRFGKLVGVKGRIMKDEDDLERKYLYLYPCQNSYEWFNFYLAHPQILIDKRVYIFESEKSVMKAHSYGFYNTLAIGSSDISKEQIDMVKGIGLDIEIVLCYDNDKTIDEIKEQADKFKGRDVFGMFDTDGLLGGKDAPVDKGLDTWNNLIENNVFKIDT